MLGAFLYAAMRAFAKAKGYAVDRQVLTPEIWSALIATSSDPIIVDYRITEKDVRGPFLKKLPEVKEDDFKKWTQ